MNSGVPFIQLPCHGVVSAFTISRPELEAWFVGKNPVADYLARNAIEAAESYAKGMAWSRVIWDVTAVAWLLNDKNRFMRARIVTAKLPSDNGLYETEGNYPISYVYDINRDVLLRDLIAKVCAV